MSQSSKILLLGFEYNVQICTKSLFPNPPLYGMWRRGQFNDFFLLGMKWNFQICTEVIFSNPPSHWGKIGRAKWSRVKNYIAFQPHVCPKVPSPLLGIDQPSETCTHPTLSERLTNILRQLLTPTPSPSLEVIDQYRHLFTQTPGEPIP